MVSGTFTSMDAGALHGWFAASEGKVLSVVEDQPFDGWLTLMYVNENDHNDLSNQMMTIPRHKFEEVVRKYVESGAFTE